MSHPDGMSLGARRVRESFNPSLNNDVDKIKRYTADLIDLCAGFRDRPQCNNAEAQRLLSLAMTAYEDGGDVGGEGRHHAAGRGRRDEIRCHQGLSLPQRGHLPAAPQMGRRHF